MIVLWHAVGRCIDTVPGWSRRMKTADEFCQAIEQGMRLLGFGGNPAGAGAPTTGLCSSALSCNTGMPAVL